MLIAHWPALLLLLTGMLASLVLQKLTVAGAVTGGLLGLVIYWGAGYPGLLIMALFFMLGTAATTWRKSEKVQKGFSTERETRRTAAQVFANAGVAALLALAAILHTEQKQLYTLMLVASFSAATADTLSSEMGNVYGKRFYNILTAKRDLKGLDGVVSLEGTLAGLFGSCLIAVAFLLSTDWSLTFFFILVIAGTIGNIADSVMGAALERKGRLQNNAVNFLNTLTGALAAGLLYLLLFV